MLQLYLVVTGTVTGMSQVLYSYIFLLQVLLQMYYRYFSYYVMISAHVTGMSQVIQPDILVTGTVTGVSQVLHGLLHVCQMLQ